MTRPRAMASGVKGSDDYKRPRLRGAPAISTDWLRPEENSCCVNAMILNYYLKHILHADEHVDKKYPHIRFVRSDLQRIAHILKPRCVSFQKLFDHFNQLTSRYKTRNKAVGETIILFHYLFESCNARI
uniref:Uncharacterized protein n=1 Tax=Sinocyclocheilus anshuiensis TaxID=1608454 RepID=A0A671QSS5_9TELE